MLIAAETFENISKIVTPKGLLADAKRQFIRFLERKLSGRFVHDIGSTPYGYTPLLDVYEFAANLLASGVIREFSPVSTYCDEPPFAQWRAVCATSDFHQSGGLAVSNARDALIPALAEALERYLWFTATDYFKNPHVATSDEMNHFPIIHPERFAGFSSIQRQEKPSLTLHSDASYLWISGYSHVQRKNIFVPAQVVSGVHGVHAVKSGKEPMILSPITTGLATGPSPEFALLNGALEIIERDAFMITWLNQLTPPQIDLAHLRTIDHELDVLLHRCARYGLAVSATLLPTDAPAHVVCTVITDASGIGPEVTIGLKAHRSLPSAVRGAALEALRIRQTVRYRNAKKPFDYSRSISTIHHTERAQYWSRSGSAEKLKFLTTGKQIKQPVAVWDNETIEQHWNRIIRWCKERDYECTSVDLTKSKANTSPWYVTSVVMPDLQPMHQTEHLIYLGGTRITEIPKQFGYTPRSELFTQEPHPFA